MKNIFIIPTDKPSRLALQLDCKSCYNLQLSEISNDWTKNWEKQNIYITNDEEIKQNWFTDNNNSLKRSYKLSHVQFANPKKIILTTDIDLIQDGVQVIDDEFLEWFIKNPDCEFIETINTSADYEGKFRYYDFKFPKQEKHYISCCKSKKECYCEKQETLEEIAEKRYPEDGGFIIMDIDIAEYQQFAFINGAKWQQERSYSEEEVINILVEFSADINKVWNITEWFNQNKKK